MPITRGATVLGFVHFFTMLLTLTIFANLVQINPSYRKAASDLGASAFGRVLAHHAALRAFRALRWARSSPSSSPIGDYVTPQILGGNAELLVPQVDPAADEPLGDISRWPRRWRSLLMLLVILVYLAMARWHLRWSGLRCAPVSATIRIGV